MRWSVCNCSGMPRSRSMVANDEYGVQRVNAFQHAICWGGWHQTDERVWRGSDTPLVEQGIGVLWTPLGHAKLVETTRRHHTLLDRVLAVQDLQSTWAALLHCSGARANYLLRVVLFDLVRSFAERNDRGLWQCLDRILRRSSEWDVSTQGMIPLPFSIRGLGLRKLARTPGVVWWY